MTKSTIITALLLLYAVGFAVGEEDPFIIARPDVNVYPQVAFSPKTNNYLVTWYYADNVIKPGITRIYAGIYKLQKGINEIDAFRVSKPTNNVTHYPYTAAAYDSSQRRFLILWQETNRKKGTRTLYLTSMDDLGDNLKHIEVIENFENQVFSPLLMAAHPDNGKVMAAWTELENGEKKNVAISIDPYQSNGALLSQYEVEYPNGKFDLAGAFVPAGDNFRLIGCFIVPKRGLCSIVTMMEFNPDSGQVGRRNKLTRKKVRRSIALAAGPAEAVGESLVAYDQTDNQFLTSSAAMLLVGDDGKTVTGPTVLSENRVFAGEVALLSKADDGLARILWLEKVGSTYTLKLQPVTEEGDVVGEPVIVRTTTQPISSIAGALGNGKGKALIVWSEDCVDGTVKLLARAVEFL